MPAGSMPGQPARAGRVAAPGTSLDAVGFHFREEMAGPVAVGETDPSAGAEKGRRDGTRLSFEVEIGIDSLGRFFRDAGHDATLEGAVTFAPLGENLPIRDGRFNLFHVDPASGTRRMTYAFSFTGNDGNAYALRGHKEVRDDAGFDLARDMTTLFAAVHRGEGERAPVIAAGELRFDLKNALTLAASMEVTGARSWWQQVAARIAFASFAWGALRDEYLKDARLLYDTQYDNVVLSGALRGAGGGEAPFFLVAGTHDRGFPWGDGEVFSDVLLAVRDGPGGWRRYAITDRALQELEIDLVAGSCRYRGPAFRLVGRTSASFSDMRKGAEGLEQCELDLDLSFEGRPYDAVNVAFPHVPRLVRKLGARLARQLRELLPGVHPLGITITPHALTTCGGRIGILERGPGGEEARADTLEILPERTFGEAEHGAFRNVKEPTLLYGYLCALRPAVQSARVQIHSRTLRDEPTHWTKDRIDAFLGSVISRTSSSEMLLEGGELRVRPIAPAGEPDERAPLLQKVGDPVIEVSNDHFPTAVFIRRIVEVQEPSGERCLALEEDMSRMNLAPIRSGRRVAVASVRGEDRLRALDRVLESTGFDDLLEAKLASSGKRREAFLVVIKPNFMFAYDRRDRSTYTDPALVHHLVGRLRERGFRRVVVAEAQSTYGEYFTHRSVREVAAYLGYGGGAGYEIVDLTLDATEERHLGEHLGRHPIPATWRDADFRISFAKNKTHVYATYTLTLKNVYGALPLANKLKEYHCARDIYATTIEYLRAFPVDYGLVDAWLSADGPFGIFADPAPNETRTVIGGGDLVAVDWVASTKMGLDPMVSRYMRLAVEAFGKPAIDLVGDASPYRPWLNVPAALPLFAHGVLDADYHFGNVFYSAASQMDEAAFQHKDRTWYMRILRRLTNPLRRAVFVRTGENPSRLNRFLSWLFYRMGY